ncbi:MAG: hypothetical protein IPN27_00050 [Cellvibrionales bacterium]|nr:hypothetical protein [Cellvibrionales bacterium]
MIKGFVASVLMLVSSIATAKTATFKSVAWFGLLVVFSVLGSFCFMALFKVSLSDFLTQNHSSIILKIEFWSTVLLVLAMAVHLIAAILKSCSRRPLRKHELN